MNGRIYDPLLGRFLSGDLIVQNPDDLQSYNRYAYVTNNPLTYTDPTGFEIDTVQLDPFSFSEKRWKPFTFRGPLLERGDSVKHGNYYYGVLERLSDNTVYAVQLGQILPTGAGHVDLNVNSSPIDVSDALAASDVATQAADEALGGESGTEAPEPEQSLGRKVAGFVPVLGSTLDGIDSIRKGNYGMAAINFSLAALDLTGSGAFVKGALVGGFKLTGRNVVKIWGAYLKTRSWKSMQANLVRNGVLLKQTRKKALSRLGLSVDHVFIRRGRGMSHWLTNAPINLNPGVTRSLNSEMNGMNLLQLARELPDWSKLAAITPATTAIGLGVGSGEDLKSDEN